MAIAVFSQTSFGRDVYAAAESEASKISYFIGKAFGIKKTIKLYANVANPIVENNEVEVKLTDVIIHKDQLTFSTIVSINKHVDQLRFNCDIFNNSRKSPIYSGVVTSGEIDDSRIIFYCNCFFDIKEIDVKENIDMKIVLSNLNYYIGNSEEEIKGKWEFEITANGKE